MNAQRSGASSSDLFADVPYNESNDIAFASLQASLVELSAMADSKANIMITVCSILLTLAVGKLEQGILVLPIVTFAVFCVPALIFAILTVMPSHASRVKPVTKHGRSEHFNPMFFVHFSQITQQQFCEEVDRVIRDPKELYRSLAKDVYNAGFVLWTKKYRYLRWSYLALLLGVCFGGVAVLTSLALSV